MNVFRTPILLGMFLSVALTVLAAPNEPFPELIGFQGVLRDGSGESVTDGFYDLVFRLYQTESDATVLWSESKAIRTFNGVFATNLGDVVPLAVDFTQSLWLEVEIAGSYVMEPRTQLTASPFAMAALSVPGNSITNVHIADNAVGASEIAAGAVRASEIAANSVGTSELAPEVAVTSFNGLTDDVTITAGVNVTLAQTDNNITVSASGGAGGDDGDWTISGSHLYHASSGVVAIGTGTPSPIIAGHATLQVVAPLYPSVVLDAVSGTLNRWVILNNSTSDDLLFGRTTSPTGVPSPSVVFTHDARMAVGGEIPGATLTIKGGNGSLSSSMGDLQVGTETEGFRLGAYTGGVLRGIVHMRATSSTGTPQLNLGVNDQRVVSVQDSTFDFFGAENQKMARFYSGDSMNEGGRLELWGTSSNPTVTLDGYNGAGGKLSVSTVSNVSVASLEATISGGQVICRDASGNRSIVIDGQYSDGYGRIQTPVLEITGGSDLSEQFDVGTSLDHSDLAAEPGLVVSIDPSRPGRLEICRQAYDRKVAGVISGAGGVRPGMLMGQQGSVANGSHPVALTGRVYVWADASTGSIEPGDLLTTSDVPGHAMKVGDHDRANGAVLGKAMTSLKSGQGLVLVLVSLQ